jgi:hypothetical protein
MKRLSLALALAFARAASAPAQPLADVVKRLGPLLCAAPNPAMKGRTDFYDHKGALVHSSAGGSPEDAVVVLMENKEPLFREILAHKCPPDKALDPKKLRELGQPYAIREFIDFDSPRGRVKLKNGLFSETKTFLYKSGDGVVRVGREKLVSGNAMEVSSDDKNAGGTGGAEGQPESQRVGKLHTHPNSDDHTMGLGAPAHHPSPQDVSQDNERGYYDVVVSPLFVFFINRPKSGSLVFDRKDPLGDNKVKDYLKKSAEADEYYERYKKFPAWFNDDFNKKNNPWTR